VAGVALRSKQVRAAQAVGAGLTHAEAGAVVGRSGRTVSRWLQDPELRAIAAREAAVPGEVGPVEILRGGLLATRPSGQPDWPTRVSAARALAALRPEEVEPKEVEPEPEHQPEPSIVVYDLPPGAVPVLHRAKKGTDAPPSRTETPSDQPPSSDNHLFVYRPPDGELEIVGTGNLGRAGRSSDGATVRMIGTEDQETAELWRAELAAGRLPAVSENEP
jgi:hypothetical protein